MLSCQPVAVHLLWPAHTKHVHQFVAVTLGLQTEAAAGQSHPAVLGTHRSVERTQEHPELWGALQVHHGMERLQAETQTETESYLVCVKNTSAQNNDTGLFKTLKEAKVLVQLHNEGQRRAQRDQWSVSVEMNP